MNLSFSVQCYKKLRAKGYKKLRAKGYTPAVGLYAAKFYKTRMEELK